MKQYFICNQEEVEIKLKFLVPNGISVDGSIEYFIDKKLNDEWHLKRFDSEYHGGGILVLKRLPQPTIDELIKIAMTSLDKNDIIGASLELWHREKYDKEDFREILINRLLQVETSTLSDFEKERLKIIIYESDLYDETNHREIVGKNYSEVQKDADYFRLNAQKAKYILSKIEK